MLFFIINFILFFSEIDTFFFSINNNHAFIECGRSIIVKNHYWFLSEFLNLSQKFNENFIDESRHIPYDQVYLILNHIFIHCKRAHELYSKQKKNEHLHGLFQWLKTHLKI